MSETSEELNQLLESLGIRDGDPILRHEFDGNQTHFRRESEYKEEEEWCDSLNSDDIDFKDYGSPPFRTEKQRKQRDRNAYCSHAAAAARSVSSRSKHRIASRCASLPLTPLKMPEHRSPSEDNISKLHAHHRSLRHKKRSQDLQRTYDRQCKFRLDDPTTEIITSAPNFDDEGDENGRCESLPPMLALKIATHSRYMSVSSRKIGNKEWLCNRKISTTGLPQDRVSFYAHMVGLLKYNSQEHSLPLDIKRSEEEVVYQQEISEMIWLELQAWHIGQDTLAYDNLLLEQRQRAKVIYDEVMSFSFIPSHKDESKFESIRIPSLKERKSSFFDTSFRTFVSGEKGIICSGCLSVWCESCHDKESEALDKVGNLLAQVDQVRSLFPSSRKLCQFFPSWKEDEFIMRHEALCLWFNVTTQLRFVIGLLGRRLSHMTKDLIPWPLFSESKVSQQLDERSPTQSVSSKDSGTHSLEDAPEKERNAKFKPSEEPLEEKKMAKVRTLVRFEFEDLDESVDSSDPSQSTGSSSDLNSTSCSNHSTSEYITGQKSSDYLAPPEEAHGLRRCSSDIFLEANPYRTYVEKLLRNKGMKKTLDKVAEVIRDIMSRVICIIEESHPTHGEKEPIKVENDSLGVNPHPLSAFQEELRKHPDCNWMSKFSSLGLPLFHTQFLFLASIPLHMMRECLKLRLEQMPLKPSRMSIKQLMSEYKEAVKFAVMVRQKFVKWCGFLLVDLPPLLATNLESRKVQAIEELDTNVKKMLEVYLEWLDQFVLMMHRETQVAGLQRNFLQEEWCFVQSTCPHVTDGESLAATRFCNIACHMLCSVGDFLDTGLDDMISDSQSSALDRVAEESVSDTTDDTLDSDDESYDMIEEDEEGIGEYKPRFQRKKLVCRCRSLQELIGEARERALRAVALAKMLKLDLEVAIEAKEVLSKERLFSALNDTKHILVKGHSLRNLVIFIPETLANCPDEILSILQIQCGGTSDKYLILLNLPSEDEEDWQGSSLYMSLNADCAIALSRVQVSGLMLIVKDGSQLQKVRRRLADTFRGILVFESQIAPLKIVTQTLLDMKNEAQQLCKVLEKSISNMEELLNVAQFFPHADEEYKQLSHLIRDTLHQGFLFGFEYHKEVARLVSGRQRSELAPFLINFGRHWIKFVRMHYATGKGIRPRWAVPGFDFMVFICDPHNTSQMTDADFKALRTEVEECREYIIGSTSYSEPSTPSTPLMMGRAFRSQSSNSSMSHPSSQTNSPSATYTDSPKFRRRPLRYINQVSFDTSEETDSTIREHPMECVREAIDKLERRIEEQRFKDKLIGRVSQHNRELIEIKPHRVSFSWHRGFKIGAGHFGKVYTAVNNNNGELMAMKVLPLQPNDHRSIKKVANELKTFERINHPNLVKYYGIEIHNDEMLMFMEYCDEGTLEALAASTEGLPEEIVRKYTRQLLLAVHTMHENGIVHRDIKGANIFLAKEGNILKLGDFGCAVRLRGLQTEINELSGIVGTHAYMAPEIFRSNEGHGRAADIWSVGCVVIEMITGKRPWPQYDSSVQIMFQVGSGKSPPIPDSLSEEGDHFLGLCFIHTPKERATAARLLDHTFVKVEEEENVSLPLFSLNPTGHLKRTRSSSGGKKAS